MSVIFLYDTFPSVSWGLVPIQWNLGHWMTLKKFTRLSFSPNAMKFGALDAKWNSIIQTQISPPSKSVKGLIWDNKTSKIGHFGSLRDLGIEILLCQYVIPVVYANIEVNWWHQSTVGINDGINCRATSHTRLKARPHIRRKLVHFNWPCD